jgi:redox-sensitive bicupin YhaK (pirin superfamily)
MHGCSLNGFTNDDFRTNFCLENQFSGAEMDRRVKGKEVDANACRLGPIIVGVIRNIGIGFTSLHFGEDSFGNKGEIVLMVSHFIMTKSTFAPHLHKDLRVLTMLFEDSRGNLVNRDTTRGVVALEAGDVYSLASGASVVHEQSPSDGASIHGLQIFIKSSSKSAGTLAHAFCTRSSEITVIVDDGHRVRIVPCTDELGSNVKSKNDDVQLLDVFICAGAIYKFELRRGRKAWIYVVSGHLQVVIAQDNRALEAGQLTTLSAGAQMNVVLAPDVLTHCVILSVSHPAG